MRKLGWKKSNVWVRSGLTDTLGQLLAEQDDNLLHKPLSRTEQAGLYRELRAVMAEDAARRQHASRFTVGGKNPRSHGAATVAAPSEPTGPIGDTRAQAARMITGHAAYTTLERIDELKRLADDESQPVTVRERAAREWAGIDAGGSITAAYQRTRAEVSLAELDRLAGNEAVSEHVRAQAGRDAAALRAIEARAGELERLAADAVARVRTGSAAAKRARTSTGATPVVRVGVMTVRAFVLTWGDLASWWESADPAVIGPALTGEQWEQFTQTVSGTVRFLEAARTARVGTSTPGDARGGLRAV